MEAISTPADNDPPVEFVEMFPGESTGCGFPHRDSRAWNTHPVRAIKASFARLLDNGERDYFSVDIPAGEIMTVETCSAGTTDLIDAHFVDAS
ncbi:MAG: hypothetical protein O7C63_04190 [Alphaproteobacteria bacterium]|nr:hypothetical protein [Alphaproteobacteria bacterium]MCZ6764117.1 hypothetical protein [Alphaproteobacteria bacterium]